MCNTDSGFALLTRESLVCHELDDAWRVTSFPNGHQSTCVLVDALKLLANAKCCLFAERPLPPAVFEVQCELALGSDKATKFGPGMAILWSNRTLRVNLRADGRFGVDDGCSSVYGGTILRNDWNHVAIRIENQKVVVANSVDGESWSTLRVFPRNHFLDAPIAVRLGKMGHHGQCNGALESGSLGVSQFKGLRVFGYPQTLGWFLTPPESQRLKGPHWHRAPPLPEPIAHDS